MTWLAKADPREAARRERRLGPESLDAGTLSLHDEYKFARAIISQQTKAQIDMEQPGRVGELPDDGRRERRSCRTSSRRGDPPRHGRRRLHPPPRAGGVASWCRSRLSAEDQASLAAGSDSVAVQQQAQDSSDDAVVAGAAGAAAFLAHSTRAALRDAARRDDAS